MVKLNSREFSETLSGLGCIPFCCRFGVLENRRNVPLSFENDLSTEAIPLPLSRLLSDYLNPFISRGVSVEQSVSLILSVGRIAKVFAAVVESSLGVFMVYQNRWIGYAKNEAVHGDAFVNAIRVLDSNRVKYCGSIAPPNSMSSPLEGVNAFVIAGVDNRHLTEGKRDSSLRRVGWLFNMRPLVGAVDTLFGPTRHAITTCWTWAVLFVLSKRNGSGVSSRHNARNSTTFLVEVG